MANKGSVSNNNELDDDLQILRERIIKLISHQNNKIKEDIRIREDLEKQLRDLEKEMQAASEMAIISCHLPKKAIVLRKRIISMLEKAKSDKITVAKKKFLETSIEIDIARLQKMCPHKFLLSYDGYEGNYLNEYSDACYGARLCMTCSLREFSTSTRLDEYKILIDNPERLVKRDIRDTPKKAVWNGFQWQSLEFISEIFRRSVGSINAHWPVMENGRMTEKSIIIR